MNRCRAYDVTYISVWRCRPAFFCVALITLCSCPGDLYAVPGKTNKILALFFSGRLFDERPEANIFVPHLFASILTCFAIPLQEFESVILRLILYVEAMTVILTDSFKNCIEKIAGNSQNN